MAEALKRLLPFFAGLSENGKPIPSHELVILAELTEGDLKTLESDVGLSEERLAEISSATGCTPNEAARVIRDYQHGRDAQPAIKKKASREQLERIRGKYAHVPGSSDDYLGEKHRSAELER